MAVFHHSIFKDYTTIPNRLYEAQGGQFLNFKSIALFGWIADQREDCYLSERYIARMTGLTCHSAGIALRELEKFGFLHRFTPVGKKTIYTLYDNPEDNPHFTKTADPVPVKSTQEKPVRGNPVRAISTHKPILKRTKPKKEPNLKETKIIDDDNARARAREVLPDQKIGSPSAAQVVPYLSQEEKKEKIYFADKKEKKEERTDIFEWFDAQLIVDGWNHLAQLGPGIEPIKALTSHRLMLLNRMVLKFGRDAVMEMFAQIPKSPFLLGLAFSAGASNTFVTRFDWVLREENFLKVWEGHYLAERRLEASKMAQEDLRRQREAQNVWDKVEEMYAGKFL